MHTLENKILIFAFQEFVYPEIIQMDQVALGICKIWSLVDFSLCNYCNFASFGFYNYLPVEIKRGCIVSILHFWSLELGFGCYPSRIHYLVRLLPFTFSVIDLSGYIAQFLYRQESPEIFFTTWPRQGRGLPHDKVQVTCQLF